jgi:hypothetical protein
MVLALNLALDQEMKRDDRVLILGEDVGVDGGVFRVTDGGGRIQADTIGLEHESLAGEPLLQPVMRAGRIVARPTLDEMRARARREIDSLPPACRHLDQPSPVEAGISAGLRALAESVDREFP